MADTDTQIPNTADAIARLYQQLMAQPAPTIPSGTPDDGTRPSWTGLLGRVLGGGQAPGFQLRGGEADTSGNRALLNFGINTLLASGPHAVRPNLLSSVATGLQGAQESADLDQSRAGALAAAQFQAQREGRQDQLARIREAIPLLQLQQTLTGSANTQKLLSGNTSPGATSGTFFDALAQIESGDQNIPSRVDKDSQGKTLAQGGNPAEISQGHYQINPDTWRRYAKQAGVDPSQYPNPMSAPKEVQAQVASVIPLSAFGPRTQKLLRDQFGDLDTSKTIGALAGARAAPSAPGQASAPASLTPSAPGAKAQIPPPTAAAPGQATPPAGRATIPSEPPLLAGGAQAAGGPGAPGAPTSGVIPTLPPAAAAASAADVADIQAGMANAQANPITPGAQPGAVVTAQAGGQPEAPPGKPPLNLGGVTVNHPGTSYQEFLKREAVPPPTTEDFSPNLSPARQAAFDAARQGIQFRIANRMNLPPAQQAAEGTKIGEDRAALEASIQKEMADKAQTAATNVTNWNKHQEEIVRPRYEQMIKNYDETASELQKQDTARQTAKDAAGYTANQSLLTSNLDIRKDQILKLRATSSAAQDAVQQLHAIIDLSKSAGASSLLPEDLRNNLIRLNIATPQQASKWSAQEALVGASNRLMGLIRTGTGFSRTTNLDLGFLTRSLPANADDSEEYRNAKAGFVLSAFKHQQDYANALEQHVSDNMKWGEAQAQAEKDAGDIIKHTPRNEDLVQDYGANPRAADQWNFDHLDDGQFYKNQKGQLKIFHSAGFTRPE